MEKLRKYTLFFSSFLLFFGCSPTRYLADYSIVPGFTEKGETQIGGGISSELINLSFSVSGAHAFSNSFALIGSSHYIRSSYLHENKKPSVHDYTDGYFGTIGLGYYYQFKNRPKFIFENYIGYGYANIENKFKSSTRITNDLPFPMVMEHYKYNKYYNQTSLTYQINKKVEIALATKLSSLNYFSIQADIDNFSNSFEYLVLSLIDQPNYYILEPHFSLRVRKNRFNIEFHINGSKILGKEQQLYNNLSTGVNLIYIINAGKNHK